MKIVDSYFVRMPNGTTAWLAAGKEPIGEVLEERPMLMPDFGKILRNKETGVESTGHWLREDDSDE